MTKISREVLRTMDYVTDSSCMTRPQKVVDSKDFRRDKEYVDIDYSDVKYSLVEIPDDEF